MPEFIIIKGITELALMGGLLVAAFIAAILFISGLIMLFTGNEGGRKYGMILVITGIIIGICCVVFHPRRVIYPSSMSDYR